MEIINEKVCEGVSGEPEQEVVTEVLEPEVVVPKIEEDTNKLLDGLLVHAEAASPREVANVEDDQELSERELVVVTVDHVLNVAAKYKWDMVRYQDFYYVYTGAHWKKITDDELMSFLGKAARKIKVREYLAKHYRFKENLVKQFYSSAYFKPPSPDPFETKINLGNGTYVITRKGHYLTPYHKNDFMLYRLNFDYDGEAKADKFQSYLDRVLPEKEKQLVLAEYLGYVFIKNSVLKLEKAAILFGSGSNGKSVFFDIVLKLLGTDNVSNFSLQNLTDDRSYTRSLLSGKLLNYASEISSKLNPTIFKMLVSGEPVEARMIYGKPFLLTDYARFMFNTNVLPKDVEHNPGFYRRFLIIHFDQTISDTEKDPDLANYIIQNELPGVFNWVLEGLNRLLTQGDFTRCESIINAVNQFKMDSDTVHLFLDDGNYQKSLDKRISLKELYGQYSEYCKDSGYRACSVKSFSERLKNMDYISERKGPGKFVFIEKKV